MKPYLLDTHVVLWWLSNSPQLSLTTSQVIQDPDNRILVSTASLWEINIKTAIGKLAISHNYAELLREDGFQILDIQESHAMKLLDLPSIHHDPFDRILVSQAMVEDCTLLTRDKMIRKYPVDFLKV